MSYGSRWPGGMGGAYDASNIAEQFARQQREADEAKRKEDEKKVNGSRKVGARKQKIRQARVGTLMDKCSICSAVIFTPEECEKIAPNTPGFRLVQHAANSDNTGYESYYCGFCKKWFLHVISNNVVQIHPQFSIGAAGAPPE